MNQTVTLKRCTKCKEAKQLTSFTRSNQSPDGRRYWCLSCQVAYNRSYVTRASVKERRKILRSERPQSQRWKPTPESVRASKLRIKYGITPEKFDRMLAAQGGRCAICGTDKPRGRHNRFVVDHCHKTGVIRGILCSPCNYRLGVMGDTADGVRAHIHWLETEVLAYLEK